MLFDHEQIELQRRIVELLERNDRISERILHLLEQRLPHPRTRSIQIQFQGDFMSLNAITLNVGQSTIASIIPLEADGTTQTPGASLHDQSYSISDPGITVTPNGDGTATIAGTAATSGAITGTATATVIDSDGTSNAFSAQFTVQVNGTTPPPTDRTAGIAVSFTDPQ